MEQARPEYITNLLESAENAATLEDAVQNLNRIVSLQPGKALAQDPELKERTYRLVQRLLEQDPFLLYLDETDDLYHVRGRDRVAVFIPKDRATPEKYAPQRTSRLHIAYRWLGIALLGLLLAGMGALVAAPVAAFWAARLSLLFGSRANRIHGLMLIMLSGFVWLLGLLLFVILVVHSV
jgi:hypothetical protein